MKFYFPINESEQGGSVTVDVVNTESTCARTNKRKLREYLNARGVPEKEHKVVLKAMGFWGERLGV